MAGSPQAHAFLLAERQERTQTSPSPLLTVTGGLGGVPPAASLCMEKPPTLLGFLPPREPVEVKDTELAALETEHQAQTRVGAELPPRTLASMVPLPPEGSPIPAPQAILAGLSLFVTILRSGKWPVNANKNFATG